LSQILYALGIVLTFGLVIGLVLRRFNYGLALVAGSLLLGIFSGLSPEGFANVLLSTLIDQVTLELALIVALIPILAFCITETGLMSEFIEGLKGMLSPKAIIAVIPAMFGILPMMGGALLSAPLIDKEADRLGLRAEKKSIINVWFRHSWIGVTPLSSALILTALLADVGLYNLILVNIPIAITHTILGYLFLIRPIKHGKNKAGTTHSHGALIKCLKCFIPIITVVVLNALSIPLSVDLAIGIGLTMALGKVNLRRAYYLLRHGFEVRLVLAIFGVMFFRHMIQDSGAVDFILSNFRGTRIPQFAFLTVIPIMFGIITAIPLAVIAMTVPLALPMFSNITPPLVSILYQSSLFSYYCSPLHLCLIVTVEYYKARLQGVYRSLIPLFMINYMFGLSVNFALLRFF